MKSSSCSPGNPPQLNDSCAVEQCSVYRRSGVCAEGGGLSRTGLGLRPGRVGSHNGGQKEVTRVQVSFDPIENNRARVDKQLLPFPLLRIRFRPLPSTPPWPTRAYRRHSIPALESPLAGPPSAPDRPDRAPCGEPTECSYQKRRRPAGKLTSQPGRRAGRLKRSRHV